MGIGTSSPTHSLQVSGTAQITGALHDSSGDAGTAGQVLSSTGTQTNWVDNSPITSGTVANSTLRWDGSDWVEATALLSSPTDVSISVSSTLATTTLTNVLQDYDGEPGTSGQVLSSTGTGTQWMSVGDLPAGDYLTASRGFRAGPNIGNPSRLGFLGGSNTYFILSNNTVPGGTSNYFNNFNNNTAVVMRRLAGGGGKFIVAQNNLGVTQFEVGRYGSAYFGDNVGIKTATPTETLSVNGTAKITGAVRLSNYGAGTVESDASGNLSVSSDERLKNVLGNFERGLEEILQLKPINYRWNELSGLEQQHTYSGFSAQNVQSVIPEAVGQDQKGYLTLSDRPIVGALVNAIKELNAKNEALAKENESLKAALEALVKRVEQLEEE